MSKPTLADHEKRIKRLELAVLALLDERQEDDGVVRDLSGGEVQTREPQPHETF